MIKKLKWFNHLLIEPRCITPPLNWVSHIPFASLLVSRLKPEVFVELGAYEGNSYLAFCQTVAENSLGTKCYAVNTWQSDESVGYCGDNVYNVLAQYNSLHYSNFSTLLRMTFDEALSHFEDGTVDLLHIDGLHKYDEVKKCFERWLPKISTCGIVFFHNINVYVDGFSIWKLWKQLSREYPCIELEHSDGLGVLFVGQDISPDVKFILDLNNNDISIFKKIMENCGDKIKLLYENTIFFEKIEKLESVVLRGGEHIQYLEAELSNNTAALNKLVSSPSWRFTLPLREVVRWVSQPIFQLRRYLNFSIKIMRTIFHRLPLSPKIRQRIIFCAAKALPRRLFDKLAEKSEYEPVKIIYERERIIDKRCYAQNIQLSTSLTPIVSIVIPVYGQCEYTLKCLASIAKYPPTVPYEVLLVDDCSPDDSVPILQLVNGIQLIKNSENKGFILSCNLAAKHAIGQYLYFLNNDTQITERAIDALLRTFVEFPNTGLAGSKLVYPDGSLQEAGGIIWQDGSAWNYGRHQNANLPIYNYAREVDYCSGASIMVPRVLFEELDGFDKLYLPAYCEDSDLALKIRKKGYRVIYQPTSVIVHFEGVTSGKDTSQGAKSYQVQNLKKQYERWKEHLSVHQCSPLELDKAKDRMATKRVLVIDVCTPMPDKDAGSVLIFNLMLLLREMKFQITFIPEENLMYLPEYTEALQRVGVEVLYRPYETSVKQHVLKHGSRYDLVVLVRPGVVDRHLKTIRTYAPGAKVIYHTIDLHYLRMMREASLPTMSDLNRLQAVDNMKQIELKCIRGVDATIVVSSIELEILQKEVPNENVFLLPLILNIQESTQTFENRKDLMFIGGFLHQPNIDAVLFFAGEIMPILRKSIPGIKIYIVGSNPSQEVLNLACEDVIVKGYVDDLAPLYENVRVTVAPLRYGAGIKGKIAGSLACGVPVVATTIASEGMGLTHYKNVLLADDPYAFANEIFKLYTHVPLWTMLSENGKRFAKNAWSHKVTEQQLKKILESVGLQCLANNSPTYLYRDEQNFKFVPYYIPADKSEEKAVLIAENAMTSRQDFQVKQSILKRKREKSLVRNLIAQAKNKHIFSVSGFCTVCDSNVDFIVDSISGGKIRGGFLFPNWRERLECPCCHLNNRQRLMATSLLQKIASKKRDGLKIFLMEEETNFSTWAYTRLSSHILLDGGDLGTNYKSADEIEGGRNEDLKALSFENDSLDVIVSNDVFEHLPDPLLSFRECHRVLRSNGYLLATFPFYTNREKSISRTKVENGKLAHVCPPKYHRDSVFEHDSSIYTDFGWDIISMLKDAGFAYVCFEEYNAPQYGNITSQLILLAVKR